MSNPRDERRPRRQSDTPMAFLTMGLNSIMSEKERVERMKGFEPSTSTLARLRSTPELHPHLLAKDFKRIHCRKTGICQASGFLSSNQKKPLYKPLDAS
jgi:hypothetical protein